MMTIIRSSVQPHVRNFRMMVASLTVNLTGYMKSGSSNKVSSMYGSSTDPVDGANT